MKILTNIFTLAGALFILFSFFLNLNILGRFFAQDGTIDNILIINYFWILNSFLFLWGILLIFNKFYLHKLKYFFFNNKKEIILFFVILFVCFIIVEGISHQIVKYNYTQLAFRNKKLTYANIEYNMSASFNSLGFRDEEFNISKNFRIAIFGDSYVLGVGVEKNETFEYLLEKKLKQKNKYVAVYNLGISGTDLSDYANTIKDFLPILKPDVTILSFYLQNDITCKKTNWIDKIALPNTIRILKEYLLSKSYNALEESFITNGKLKDPYKYYLKKGLINPTVVIQSITHPDINANHRLIQQWFKDCSINKNLLLKIKSYTDIYSSRFIILIVPPNYQVSSKNWKSIEDLGYVINDSLLENRELQDSILAFCSQQKLECIDLLPPLKNNKEFPYFNLESHFNRIGHEITSEALLKII